MKRIIVGFAEAILPGVAFAQTLAPVADSGISVFVVIAVGVAAFAAGMAVQRYIVKNPSALPQAQLELLSLLHKAQDTANTLAAKVEHKPDPAAPAPEPQIIHVVPPLTPEQRAAMEATVKHLQEQLAPPT